MTKFILIIILILSSCVSKKPVRVDQKDAKKIELDTILILIDTITPIDNIEPILLESRPSRRPVNSTEVSDEIKPKSSSIPTAQNINNINNDRIGELLYLVPDTMQVGNANKISIRIINSISQRSNLTQNLSTNNQVHRIRTSSRMQVEIKDPHSAFLIVSLNNSSVQIVDSIEYTEWLYNITPTKSGQHPLIITSSIISEDGTRDRTYHNVVYVKNAIIYKTKKFWIQEWKWLLTTLIIPFIIWFFKNRKREKNKG